MATLKELEAKAKNAQKLLNEARKREDENLGKRLRESLAGEKRLSREAQIDLANAFLNDLSAQRSMHQTEQPEERQEEQPDGDGGQGYGGNAQYY